MHEFYCSVLRQNNELLIFWGKKVERPWPPQLLQFWCQHNDGTRGFSKDLKESNFCRRFDQMLYSYVVVYRAKVKLGAKIALLKGCTELWGYTHSEGGARGGVWPTSHLTLPSIFLGAVSAWVPLDILHTAVMDVSYMPYTTTWKPCRRRHQD